MNYLTHAQTKFIDVLYIFRHSAHPLFQILYFLKARGSRIYKYTNIQIQILSISANVRTVIQSSTTSHPKDCHIFSDEPASLALMIVTGSLTHLPKLEMSNFSHLTVLTPRLSVCLITRVSLVILRNLQNFSFL